MSLLGEFVAEFDTPHLHFTIKGEGPEQAPIRVRGIIDTGASVLCIPKILAVQLGLRFVRLTPTVTAGGIVSGNVFLARVTFADLNYSDTLEVLVPETNGAETPILIGMSVLRQFNIWYHGGMETWSFYRRELHS
jgi:predicted aspartyl protease